MATKCFSGIVSRLLCSKALPTHPSEQLIEEVKEENAKRDSSPGVVARLMGLDSFPPKERTLGDFFRSRSVNSIDFLSHFDPIKHKHRRVRTSVSFREGVDDDEYTSVVLLFQEQPQGKTEEGRTRRKNSEYFNKVVSNRHVKNLEIHDKGKSESVSLPPVLETGRRLVIRKSVSRKIDLEGKMRANLKERRPVTKGVKSQEELMRLKKKKRSKIFTHKLNSDFKKIQPQGTAPEVAKRASPRKHLPPQTANSQSHSPFSNAAISDSVEARQIIAGKNESKMKINEMFYYKKEVAEEDVKENWVCGMELEFETFDEISQLFGQEILEGLLEQFVDDLVLHFGQLSMIN